VDARDKPGHDDLSSKKENNPMHSSR
jgi:hypothetical protein